MAIGVIMGAAFGAIVASMVGDIIMPVVGAATGGLDFSNYYLPLSSSVKTGLSLADAKKAGAVWAYGNFITITINFIIIAFVLFLIIQLFNKMKKKGRCQTERAAGHGEIVDGDQGFTRPARLTDANGPSGQT